MLWVIIPLFLFLKLNIGKRYCPYGILFHICMHPVSLCEKGWSWQTSSTAGRVTQFRNFTENEMDSIICEIYRANLYLKVSLRTVYLFYDC